MAALQPVSGGVKIHHKLFMGIDETTGFHLFMNTGGPALTQPQADAVALAVEQSWTTNLTQLCSAGVSYQGAVVTDLSSPTGPVSEKDAVHGGTRTGEPLGANTAAILNFKIQRRYRGGKPRVYAPFGVATDLQNTQTWTTTAVSAFTTGFTNHVIAIATAMRQFASSSYHANISYFSGGSWSLDPVTGRPRWHPNPRTPPLSESILSIACNPLIGSQRRRVRS